MIDPETKRYIDQQIDTLRREIRAGGIESVGSSGTAQRTVAYAVSAGAATYAVTAGTAQAAVMTVFNGSTVSFSEDWTDE